MNDLQGWGVARKMIELYGKDAQIEARRRSERAFDQDDMAGFERWTNIASIICSQLSRNTGIAKPEHPLDQAS